MVRKLIEWSLNNPLRRSPAGCRAGGRRRLFLPQRQRRGLPRPGAGHRRGHGQVPRRLRGGSRAAGHHPPGSDLRRHARPEVHAQQVAVRPERPQNELELRQPMDLRGGPAGGHQSHGHDRAAVAAGREPPHLARVAHRRNLPLHPERPQGRFRPRDLHAQRPQGDAGLGAGARVPHRAADRGPHQLRRHRPALRGPARPGPPAALRHHAGPAAERADQQQRHRGRRLRQPGPGGPDRAQRRPVRRRQGPGEQGARAGEQRAGGLRQKRSRRGRGPRQVRGRHAEGADLGGLDAAESGPALDRERTRFRSYDRTAAGRRGGEGRQSAAGRKGPDAGGAAICCKASNGCGKRLRTGMAWKSGMPPGLREADPPL